MAEQADRAARGHWSTDGFVLDTALDEDALTEFFASRYSPTPILTPWNNSSGFGPEGVDELGAIERSSDQRLAQYRLAIDVARRVMSGPKWVASKAKPERDRKREQVTMCRAALPDGAIRWLDAAVVLTSDRAVFPPALGTGGNDGRLEFSRNFHQRVLDVLGLTKAGAASSVAWLGDALDGTSNSRLVGGKSPGQFDAAAAGGPNSSPTGAAQSLLNPWDWVLLLEGAVVLAGGAARRFSTDTGDLAAAPFTVRSSTVGYVGAAEAEGSRGELWLPLWDRPTGFAEVARLFAEGRVEWARRQARTGLEFAKAVSGLGVDRGIDAFSRHGLLERNGLSTVAVPLGRVRVATSRSDATGALAALDTFVDPLRRAANLPKSVRTALRTLDEATFACVAARGSLLAVLLELADLHEAVAGSPTARAACRSGPLSLAGDLWAAALLEEGNIAEVRLALSLASCGDRNLRGDPVGGIRDLVLPRWDSAVMETSAVLGLGRRPIVEVLADAHARRVVECERRSHHDVGPDADYVVGVPTRYPFGTPPPLADLAALVRAELDEQLLGKLVRAMLLLRLRRSIEWPEGRTPVGPVAALSVVGPFYSAQPASPERLFPDAAWPSLLAAGQLVPVLSGASARLTIGRWRPVVSASRWRVARADPEMARRLGAALLWPISISQRRGLLERSCPPDPPTIDNRPSPTEETDDET